MRVVRMILATAILAGSTAAADARTGGQANNPPQASQSSVRAGDTVPDRRNRPHKNHRKGSSGSVCSNGISGKSSNCAPTVSPQ